MNEFDESEAIAFIREQLPAEKADKYSDDQLLNVIDLIWDFYEENGLLEIDCDENIADEAFYDDLLGYARKMLRKDKDAGIDEADIEPIIKAEIEYENSLEA